MVELSTAQFDSQPFTAYSSFHAFISCMRTCLPSMPLWHGKAMDTHTHIIYIERERARMQCLLDHLLQIILNMRIHTTNSGDHFTDMHVAFCTRMRERSSDIKRRTRMCACLSPARQKLLSQPCTHHSTDSQVLATMHPNRLMISMATLPCGQLCHVDRKEIPGDD